MKHPRYKFNVVFPTKKLLLVKIISCWVNECHSIGSSLFLENTACIKKYLKFFPNQIPLNSHHRCTPTKQIWSTLSQILLRENLWIIIPKFFLGPPTTTTTSFSLPPTPPSPSLPPPSPALPPLSLSFFPKSWLWVSMFTCVCVCIY